MSNYLRTSLALGFAAFSGVLSGLADAQATTDWYELFAVADAQAEICAKGDKNKIDSYRESFYFTYLGKDEAISLLAEEKTARKVLKMDTYGFRKYELVRKEAETLLNDLTESGLQNHCQFILERRGNPGFLQLRRDQ